VEIQNIEEEGERDSADGGHKQCKNNSELPSVSKRIKDGWNYCKGEVGSSHLEQDRRRPASLERLREFAKAKSSEKSFISSR